MAEFLPGDGGHGCLVVVDPGVLGLGQHDIVSVSSLAHGKFLYFFSYVH